MIASIFTPLTITVLILLISAFFFMRGKVRSDLVALCALLALMLTDILTPAEALSGFSNSVVIMMVGLFVVGAGIFRTGLAKMISSKILKLAGDSNIKLFVLVMLVTASIGAFVSNTGTVAVMLPIVVSIAASSGMSSRKFLMPMAFASSMGLFTLISTPPNMVIQEALIEKGYRALGFFEFAPVGFISLLVGVLVLPLLSKWFLSKDDSSVSGKKAKRKTLLELAEEYKLNKVIHLEVKEDSPVVNKTIKELGIRSTYSVNIVRIDKPVKTGRKIRYNTIATISPETIVEAGDILYCHGKDENIYLFVEKCQLELLNDKSDDSFSDFQEAGIAEVFIMPNSGLINRTVEETRFREEYNVNVLGIQRQGGKYIYDVKNQKLHSGDALLIQGTWDDIANLDNRQNDLVLVGQPLEEASKVTLDQKAPVAAGIMLLMVIAMTFNIVPAVTAVMVAAVLMVVTGCLRNVEEAYKNINWESVVLIAAMMPMSLAFEKTGAADLISSNLVGTLGKFGPVALLAGIYFGTSLLTMFISNTATAVLFTPIALQAAQGMGASPYPFLFAVAVSASMCFASPFSTPPNALVMSAGRYSFIDYIKVGLPLQLIMGIVMVIVLPLLFPFELN